MDTQALRAQLRQAQANHRRSEINVDAARAQVVQRKAENEAALAGRAQRQAELDAAQRRFERSKQLVKRGTAAVETFDNDRARFERAKAAVSAAEAQIAATHSAIRAAESHAVAADAAVDAAKATMHRNQADIDDSALSSPHDGRVQYRVAQRGEALKAGLGISDSRLSGRLL